MRMFDSVASMRTAIRAARQEGHTIGFVPTMGALHDGHLSLARRARTECDFVVMSVFVNPTQFGPGEDFARYPRQLNRDSAMAQKVGVHAVFAPPPDAMYPAGAQTVVSVPGVSARWEGAARPTHFAGVATVCAKLFSIVEPDRVYMGLKDLQQVRVLQRMATDLILPLKIIPCETVREPDGLAMSSRNAYLSEVERTGARVLYQALAACEHEFRAGERSVSALEAVLQRVLAGEPLARPDYATVVDAVTLEPIDTVEAQAAAIVAVRVGATRLIDNLLFGPN